METVERSERRTLWPLDFDATGLPELSPAGRHLDFASQHYRALGGRVVLEGGRRGTKVALVVWDHRHSTLRVCEAGSDSILGCDSRTSDGPY